MKKSTCLCGKEFLYRPVMFNGREIFSTRLCDECVVRRAAAENKALRDAIQARLEEDWRRICPVAFQEFDLEKLPAPELYSAAMAWRSITMPGRGLMLSGESRMGKSRTAWQLLRREHFQGRQVAYMTGLDMMRYVAILMWDSQECAGWVEKMSDADLLLLDDCFKAKMTPRAEEALFAIVDHRTQHGLPMIVTLNDSVDSLLPRLSEDRGAPLVARLKEFCEVLKV